MPKTLVSPTPEAIMSSVLDITAPTHGVQIRISADESTVWVNVDGLCILRIGKIPKLVQDHATV